MIRVLIAEDQALLREALGDILAREDDIEVVAQVGRGDEVIAAAERSRPDVALMDIEMPGQDGISVIDLLSDRVPACRALVLTVFNRPGYLRKALDAGAAGFILKDASPSELASAIRRVARGERVVDPGLAIAALEDGENPLTAREQQILGLSDGGSTAGEVGRRLGISEGTVRNHLSVAIQKMQARTKSEAARAARDKGWL